MAADVTRIHILGIPIDVVDHDALPGAIEKFYRLGENRQIVFLDMHELMRARHNKERRQALTQAALVIPVSTMIVRAARFLKQEVPPLRRPYPFIIRLLGILEEKNKSVYLLGTTMKGIRQAESSLKATYPGLQIVGRYSSTFPAGRQQDIVTAIKKASPTLLLAGAGLKGRHLWVSRKRNMLAPGLSIWEESCLEVFSGRKSKPNEAPSARIFRGFFSSLVRPWRFLRMFRYLFSMFCWLLNGYENRTCFPQGWDSAPVSIIFTGVILVAMLNFRLLYVLISPRSVRTYLGLTAALGVGVLIDVFIFLKLSLLIGPWITMALLSVNTALGIFIMFGVVESHGQKLVNSIDDGRFSSGLFSRYLSTLVASLFLIVPGLLNSVAGLILMIPYIGEKSGRRLAQMAGIDWQEAYEYLRLDRITGNKTEDFAQS